MDNPASSRLALAHRRKDVHAINQAIKSARRASGETKIETFFETDHGPRSFSAGDRLLFTRNDGTLNVRSPADLLSPSEALKLSGLEFMQAILDGTNPGPPIGQAMGYSLHDVSDGKVTFRGAPGFDMTNPLGTVHGGWYGTLLDSAMACAVMTKVPRGSIYTTLEYKINILRAIPLDTEIDCVGMIDHVGRSTGVAHGEIRGVADNRLYATGSTTCIVMKIA